MTIWENNVIIWMIVQRKHGACLDDCEYSGRRKVNDMNIEEMLEIHDCPLCDGGALLEEESGCGYYVMCLECGCQSVTIDFHSEEERLEAAKKTVTLWNAGKVISCNPGE